MIRFLIYILLIGALGASVYYLELNSGDVRIDAFNYHIKTSFTIFLLVLLAVVVVLQVLSITLYKLTRIPEFIRQFFLRKKLENVNINIIGMVKSIVDGDENSLVKNLDKIPHAKDVDDYFEALKLIFSSPQNDFEKLQDLCSTKLKKAKAKLPILKAIVAVYKNRGCFKAAYPYASDLYNISPSQASAVAKLQALVEIEDFDVALKFLNEVKGYLPKDQFKEVYAYLNWKMAEKAYKSRDFDAAKTKLSEVLKVHEMVDAVCMLGLILVHSQEYSKAMKLFKQYWDKFSGPQVRSAAFHLAKHLGAEEFLSFARDLKKESPNSYDSFVILSRAELMADQFDKAYKNISEAMAISKVKTSYLLMLEFCLRSHGSNAEISNWLEQVNYAEEECYDSKASFNINKLAFDTKLFAK